MMKVYRTSSSWMGRCPLHPLVTFESFILKKNNKFENEIKKKSNRFYSNLTHREKIRCINKGVNYKSTWVDLQKNPNCPKNQQKVFSKNFTSINTTTPYQICFLRHGQSTWNRDNRFIGWTDTPLTEDGVLEARVAGQMLANSGMLFDEVHTSLLRRSIRTSNLVLMEMGQEYIHVYKHWRLNERNYGDLVGKNKKDVVKAYGVDQVRRWRRSYDEPPPPMKKSHEYWPGRDPRYRAMIDKIPDSESLCDTIKRSSVYWDEVIIPALKEGKTILIVGHENCLRSLIMRLEGISKQDIINLSLPRAVPLAYRLDPVTWQPLPRHDGSLDEATGFLRGEWLGGDKAVKEILGRDDKQVYDTKITENLELGKTREKWKTWMEFAIGKPDPEMTAKSAGSEICGGDNVQQMTTLSKKKET